MIMIRVLVAHLTLEEPFRDRREVCQVRCLEREQRRHVPKQRLGEGLERVLADGNRGDATRTREVERARVQATDAAFGNVPGGTREVERAAAAGTSGVCARTRKRAGGTQQHSRAASAGGGRTRAPCHIYSTGEWSVGAPRPRAEQETEGGGTAQTHSVTTSACLASSMASQP